jgi:AraC-like DNA-binding protein/mannose-6-phosphate isomerase-like protein (cupin superfamily)
MSSRPTYKARNAQYEIDRCEPQNRAIESGKILFHALTKGHYPGTPVPENVLSGLSSIGFWNAGGAQDWGLDTHRNEGIEIMFLETGTMAFVADDKKHNLRAGQFTITRPWQPHKLGAPNIGPGRLHWLILDVGVRRPHQDWHWPPWMVLTTADLAELTRKMRHNENPVWHATPAITHSFRELARTVESWHQPHAVSRLATHLNQLFLSLLDALSEQQTHETPHLTTRQRTVELFLQEVKNNPAIGREMWTINTMAEHCGMGVTAFSKYCRELVNTGPMEYLNQCRLDFAARELRAEPHTSITDIAYRNGFNASQYFATRFRQRFGQTPSDYREQK